MSRNNAYFSNEACRIGTKKQLFVDNTMIEDKFGVVRKLIPPLKYSNQPVLMADKIWENGLVFAPTVLFDEEEQIYKMWYSSFHAGAYFKNTKAGIGARYYLCYATSEDGFNWVKPKFSMFPFGRYKETNIIFRGVDSSAGNFVFRDPNERDPARKYKMIYTDRGLRLAYSPEGIHWTPVGEDPIIATHSDCNNHVTYDAVNEKWLLYMRPIVFSSGIKERNGIRHMRRRVAISESKDLLHWSKPRCIIVPDETDASDIDAISVFQYEGKYIGLMSTFNDVTEEERAQQGQMMRTELTFSNDGYEWSKLPDKPIFIDHGPEGCFDAKQIYMTGSGPVELFDNELAFYYSGANWNGNDVMMRSFAIGLVRLRQDGFVEQYASEGGYLVTKEFILEGNELEINCKRNIKEVSSICVEIAEYPGKPIEGYSLEDCDPIVTNDISRVVTWKGSKDLEALRGKAIYVRFYLKHAGIYSFKINDRR